MALNLGGPGGNAFSILGRANAALKQAGASEAEVAGYMAQATAGDYDNLLATTRKWCHVTDEEG